MPLGVRSFAVEGGANLDRPADADARLQEECVIAVREEPELSLRHVHRTAGLGKSGPIDSIVGLPGERKRMLDVCTLDLHVGLLSPGPLNENALCAILLFSFSKLSFGLGRLF